MDKKQQFCCCECPKNYKNKASLNRHIKESHSSSETQKEYACEYENCDKTYIRINQLQNHIKVKHKMIQICCTECRVIG